MNKPFNKVQNNCFCPITAFLSCCMYINDVFVLLCDSKICHSLNHYFFGSKDFSLNGLANWPYKQNALRIVSKQTLSDNEH